jgi:hypothetical protein
LFARAEGSHGNYSAVGTVARIFRGKKDQQLRQLR